MTQALTLPSIGDLVDGKFRIGRKLGEGGTSTIYEVSHNITDKKFAIKWLLPELALNDAAVERFIHEAKVGGRFVHPHAVQVYDICKANDSFYILMELLEGESLQTRLERVGRLSVRDACDILLPCADAVAAAHRAGIIHRDLKPANIFLCSTSEHDEHTSGVRDLHAMRDVPKVLDFGISKLTTRAFGLSPITTTTSTRTVIGTPLYMAPEQMRGEPTDPRTDIYALGIVLYQLVAGQPPFAGENYAELVFKVTVAGKPAPLEEIDGVDATFAGVVARAMARDVDGRFGSVAELVQALLPYSSLRVGAGERRVASQAAAFRSREEIAQSDGAPEHTRRARRRTTPDGSQRLGGAVFEGPRVASALDETRHYGSAISRGAESRAADDDQHASRPDALAERSDAAGFDEGTSGQSVAEVRRDERASIDDPRSARAPDESLHNGSAVDESQRLLIASAKRQRDQSAEAGKALAERVQASGASAAGALDDHGPDGAALEELRHAASDIDDGRPAATAIDVGRLAATTIDDGRPAATAIDDGRPAATAVGDNQRAAPVRDGTRHDASAIDDNRHAVSAIEASRHADNALSDNPRSTPALARRPGVGVRRDAPAVPLFVPAVSATRASQITLSKPRRSRGKVAVVLPLMLGAGLAFAWLGRDLVQHGPSPHEQTSYVRPREPSPPMAATLEPAPQPVAAGSAADMPIGHASVESRARVATKLRALPSGRSNDERQQKPTRRASRVRESSTREADARDTKSISVRATSAKERDDNAQTASTQDVKAPDSRSVGVRAPDARAEESRDTAQRANESRPKAKRASASTPAIDVRLERGDFNAPAGLTPPEAVVSRNDF